MKVWVITQWPDYDLVGLHATKESAFAYLATVGELVGGTPEHMPWGAYGVSVKRDEGVFGSLLYTVSEQDVKP